MVRNWASVSKEGKVYGEEMGMASREGRVCDKKGGL